MKYLKPRRRIRKRKVSEISKHKNVYEILENNDGCCCKWYNENTKALLTRKEGKHDVWENAEQTGAANIFTDVCLLRSQCGIVYKTEYMAVWNM